MAKDQSKTVLQKILMSGKNIGIVVIGIVIGIFILRTMASNRPPAEEAEVPETELSAFFMQIEAVNFQPHVVGLGAIEPAQEVTVSSEVSGQIAWVHPDLQNGRIIEADTVVIRVDDVDFQLSLNQAQADLAVQRNSLQQLEYQERNYRLNLDSARERLELTRNELDRLQSLVDRGLASSSDIEAQQQSVLSLEAEVASNELNLELIPNERSTTLANIISAEAQVEQAQRDLARSQIRLPVTGRIGEVQVTGGSYVGASAALFDVSSIDAFEVGAQLSSRSFQNTFNTGTLQNNLTAIVRLVEEGNDSAYFGTPQRIESELDSNTRMMSVVVALDELDDRVTKGAYAEVTILGPEASYWVVPRSAINAGQVYMANDDDQLQLVDVNVDFYQGNYAVLTSELPFERLITSQVFPAVSGMSLELFENEETREAMVASLNAPASK